MWNILTQNKCGYSRHPETLRWKGKLAVLYQRHDELVNEMTSRNYNHKTELDKKYAIGYRVRINL
ncbi:MAG TPA: pyrimidine dimer DNA glycosylase/endonuclease V [Nitrososphaeraceae archaeon]|nr:pyrimidine dimer DNA glycosylase/endonuclease V [Nitrososphaeraceae archaeon]